MFNNSSLLVHILSQMNPAHTCPRHFPKIHSNILPSTSTSSKLSLPFKFLDKKLVRTSHLSHACYMPRPAHLPWLDYLAPKLWSSSLSSFLQPPATSSHFSNTLNLRSPLSVRDKTAGKIIVLYILISKVLREEPGRRKILKWFLISSLIQFWFVST